MFWVNHKKTSALHSEDGTNDINKTLDINH